MRAQWQKSLTDANARGMHSHGVLRVENYVKKLAMGSINPHPDIKTLSESPFSAVLDGDNGLGCIVSQKAAELCRCKAEAVGIGCVSVRNSNHYGTSAYYCEQMAGDDMIAFSCSNVEPIMAPPGATKWPLAQPLLHGSSSGRHRNFCSDMASSQIAWGRLWTTVSAAKSYQINGQLTLRAIQQMTLTERVFLMPMGAHKGIWHRCTAGNPMLSAFRWCVRRQNSGHV